MRGNKKSTIPTIIAILFLVSCLAVVVKLTDTDLFDTLGLYIKELAYELSGEDIVRDSVYVDIDTLYEDTESYDGKILRYTGYVYKMDTDTFGRDIIDFTLEKRPETEKLSRHIKVTLPSSEEAELFPGDKIKVYGMSRGFKGDELKYLTIKSKKIVKCYDGGN